MASIVISGDTSGTVTLAAPTVAGTQSYTLPTAVPAANGYALTSTTGGTMSWAAISATAGSNSQVIYNSGGTLAGSANLVWDGNGLFIGSAVANAKLSILGSTNVSMVRVDNTIASGYTGTYHYSTITQAAATTFDLYGAYANSVAQFRVRGDGTIYAQNTTVQSASDVRLKENIKPSAEGLQTILGLNPVRFDYKAGFGNDKKNQLGFIAQEIEQVFPDAVDVWGESDDPQNPYKSVGPSALIPVLVKAIQELSAANEAFTARIAALEAK